MADERANYYGVLLFFLMSFTLIGLFTSEPQTTGFAVKLTKCFEGTSFGECSIAKPRYCDNGALKPDCQRCGCIEGEFCQDDGTCIQKCSDGTLFGYCSENKPTLCHKGNLLQNCFECGCFPGQICSSDGSCTGETQLGAGAEPEPIVEEIQEPIPEEIKEPVKEEKQPEAGLWWKLFCKVLYFNEYDVCIADAIRYQNK